MTSLPLRGDPLAGSIDAVGSEEHPVFSQTVAENSDGEKTGDLRIDTLVV